MFGALHAWTASDRTHSLCSRCTLIIMITLKVPQHCRVVASNAKIDEGMLKKLTRGRESTIDIERN